MTRASAFFYGAIDIPGTIALSVCVYAVNFNDLSSALIHISIRIFRGNDSASAAFAFRAERRMAKTSHSAFECPSAMSSRFYRSIKRTARRRESFGAEISQRCNVSLSLVSAGFRARVRERARIKTGEPQRAEESEVIAKRSTPAGE